MNANKTKQELIKLHRNYTYCVNTRLEQFLKADEAEAKSINESEWCTDEKHAYLEYMRVNVPVEYNNIMRMEETTF